MKKQIHTFFDSVNNCNDATILLKHIAKMMAMRNQEYTDAFAADDLRYAIAEEMLAFAHKTKGQNYEVVCTYQGITESSTFRAMELFSITELVHDIMGVEEYMDKVVHPIAKELAARIISKIDGPLSATSCDIVVRLA
jgi:energy-converting hydrogenase A subunit M